MSTTTRFYSSADVTARTPYFASADAPGISCFAFDENTASATPLAVTEGIDNPTFLAADNGGRRVYAGSEVHGWNEGTVSAYEIDPSTGGLIYINKQPTRGSPVRPIQPRPDRAVPVARQLYNGPAIARARPVAGCLPARRRGNRPVGGGRASYRKRSQPRPSRTLSRSRRTGFPRQSFPSRLRSGTRSNHHLSVRRRPRRD